MKIDEDTRNAILKLAEHGVAKRAIAAQLHVARNTVRAVLRSEASTRPRVHRPELCEPHDARIRELFDRCGGSRERVHEELARESISIPYSTLTRYCRSHRIGVKPKAPAGRYSFEPGAEMQHDTSPHSVLVGTSRRQLQCAGLVLCYSRRRFTRVFVSWTRHEAKIFLTEGLRRFGSAAAACMVDNLSVVVASGNGPNAVMAPEMGAFARRFGFKFVAHKLKDANRSAHVERTFDYVERNFYKGRTFHDVAAINAQMAAWNDADDLRPRRSLGGLRPIDLFATEQPLLKPLPAFIPEPARRHSRTVDSECFVNLHSNRYSAPLALLERDVIVFETATRVRIYDPTDTHSAAAEHALLEPHVRGRSTLPEHEAEWTAARRAQVRNAPSPLFDRISKASPILARLAGALAKRHGGRATRPLQHLDRLRREYPIEPLEAAVARALEHGLFDLARIEIMVLREVTGNFFRLPDDDPNPHEDT